MSELSGLCLDWKNCIVVFFAMSLSKLLCRFCQSNGEDESWYHGHVTRSPAGKVLCPVLRVYTCPVCAVIGDNAHTSSTAPRTGGEVFNLLQEASG